MAETTPHDCRDAAGAVAGLDHRLLRSALEFAVAIAEAGQRLRPPLAHPADLKSYFKEPRLPSAALGRLRRAVEADPTFRSRLGAAATDELVDPIGLEWLRRQPGWEQRIGRLAMEAEEAATDAAAATALKRAERRREAAEQAAVRTRAELAQLQARLDDLVRQLGEAQGRSTSTSAEVEAARVDANEARTTARHANDRAAAARQRLAGVEAARDSAVARAAEAEAQRDALLAERAERIGVALAPAQMTEMRDVARAVRALADRLGRVVDAGGNDRKPLALPGGVAGDSKRATEFLLRAPDAVVLIDGYNVAKLGWVDAELIEQRERCLDVVDDLVRRVGSNVTVVFDGADVVGSHAARRRLARVVYSPAGVSADDVLRAEVAGLAAARPVVVVTNDQAIRRDVAAVGANLVSSDAFLALARG